MNNKIKITSVSEDLKSVFFESNVTERCILNVYDNKNFFIFSNEIYLIPNVNYYSSWVNSWYDKKIEFVFDNTTESYIVNGESSKYNKDFCTLFLNKKNFINKTELCHIMDSYGSDKGSVRHNYTKLYYHLFKKIRNESLNIFELGLGTNNTDVESNMGDYGRPGASLRGWRDFFKNSNIFGADIDDRILFNEYKIKTFYCDQTNKDNIKSLWENEEIKGDFDIIIEDGLHKFSANVIFLENSLHKIKNGGYYIIEDINVDTITKWMEYFEYFRKQFKGYTIEFIFLENEENIIDNNIILIKNEK